MSYNIEMPQDIELGQDDDLSNLGSNKTSIAASQPPWDESHEKVLIEWADKAQCFRWLHTKSYGVYRTKAMWFTIPVIIMSTITGTANFAQERFPPNIKTIAVMSIGGINLIAGIITTISQYLKVNELMESHRVASLSWDKFVRDIKMELAKDPRETEEFSSQREPPITCLTKFKETFDRLMEVSPNIEDKMVQQFLYTFDEDKLKITEQIKQKKQRILYHKNSTVPPVCRPCVKFCKCYDCFNDPSPPDDSDDDEEAQIKATGAALNSLSNGSPNRRSIGAINTELAKKKKNQPIIRPDICGQMESSANSCHPWRVLEKEKEAERFALGHNSKAKDAAKRELDKAAKAAELRLHEQERLLQQAREEERKKQEIEANKKHDETKNRITNFIIKFRQKYHRLPLVDDVKDALSDVDENEIANHEAFSPIA